MFIHNEYFEEYMNIIFNALSKNRSKRDRYYELHHIIPRKVEPLLENDKKNLVLLTPGEHFKCHILLPFFTEGKQRDSMIYAWNQMSNRNENPINYKEYDILKEEYSRTNSRKMSGEGHWNYGNKYSKEESLKFGHPGEMHPFYNKKRPEHSLWMKKNNPTFNKDMSSKNNPMYGKNHSEETRKKISNKKKGHISAFNLLTGNSEYVSTKEFKNRDELVGHNSKKRKEYDKQKSEY